MKQRVIASFLICTLAMSTAVSCSSGQGAKTGPEAVETEAETNPAAETSPAAETDTAVETDPAAETNPTAETDATTETNHAAETDTAAADTDAAQSEATGSDVRNVGAFSTTDIYGNPVDESIFADCDLTLVNVFATWCGPCINELPELEKLSQNLAGDSHFQVLGFVLDTADAGFSVTDGTDEAIEKAQLLAKETGCTFSFVIPDTTGLNGRLVGINAIPESFFVDSEGNIVGETYVGARDYETWESIVKTELADLEKGEAQ